MTALAPEAAPMDADGTVTLRPLLGMVGRTLRPVDEDARPCFGEALARHRPGLLRYLRTKVGNEADAADLAQEAWARMLVYRDRSDSGVDPRLMLFRIANNLVIPHF